MKKIILSIFLIISAASLAASLAASKEEIIGFDKPLFSEKTIESNIELFCWVYKNFAVIQINDLNSMGAREILVRKYNSSESKLDICAKTSPNISTAIKNFYGYFKGSRDGYLFIDEPDSFGNQQAFQVFSKDGKEILREIRDSTNPMLIKKAKKTSITFYKALVVSCPLAAVGSGCWKKVISDNKIPTSLKIQMPDCKTAFQKDSSSLDNNALVSTKVEIKDLNYPVIKYMSRDASCAPSP